jgi:hypothetical protein
LAVDPVLELVVLEPQLVEVDVCALDGPSGCAYASASQTLDAA